MRHLENRNGRPPITGRPALWPPKTPLTALTGCLYREMGGEEFLKQFMSQEEEKGLKYPKPFPLQLLMEKEKSFPWGRRL